ncbi:MAG: GNAT family N-acetyltransferase [Actinomycetota bacterium]|nr:GNAT family N-acetyltransferase [Actinomycetota bacterium]
MTAADPPARIPAGRIVLRRWEPDNAPLLVAAVTESIEHLRPWMPWIADEPQTVARRRQLITQWREEGEAVYGMFDEEGVRVLGGCGLHARIGPGALEIGYWVHVAHVRNGHATAAARALTGAAFALDGIERVEIHCDEANRASAAVPRKLGFDLVRAEDRERVAPGETGRHLVWAVERAHPRLPAAPTTAAT